MAGPYTRSCIGFLTVALAYALYAHFAVPLIEPETRLPDANPPAAISRAVTSDSSPLQQFEHLFPVDAWELDGGKTKILDSENGKLLFRDYQPLPDGSIEVQPFSLIFFADSSPEDSTRRPVLLRANDGATLKFDPPLRLGQAEVGRFIGGRIRGQVRIHSPASQPDGQNQWQIETRNIHLDERKVFTPHDVSFRFGRHWGTGRNLTIQLLADKAGQDSLISTSGIKSIELVYVDKMHIDATGHRRPSSAATPPPNTRLATSETEHAPLEITCRGPFLLDAQRMTASFEDHVDVLRVRPDGPSDQLNCQLLEVHFGPPDQQRQQRRQGAPPARVTSQANDSSQAAAGGSAPPPDRSAIPLLSGLDVQRIVAVGYPVTVHTDYELEANRLQCDVGAGGELDTFWVDGSGRVYQVGDDGRTAFSATWSQELTFQPHEGEHVLSLIGQAVVHIPGQADFTADQLHLWISPVNTHRRGSSQRPAEQVVPRKMLATGNVQFESIRLAGQTDRMEAWFVEAPPAPPSPVAAASNSSAPATPGRAASARVPADAGQQPGSAQSLVAGRTQNSSKYDLHGKLVRMELFWDRRKNTVASARELIVAGDVHVWESSVSDPAAAPLELSGDLLNILPGPANAAVASVTGHPAQVAARGLKLAGQQIHLDQAANRIWIDSPGTMTLPARGFDALLDSSSLPAGDRGELTRRARTGSSRSGPAVLNQPAETLVSWQRRMEFDGRLARFQGSITAETTSVSRAGERRQAVIHSKLLHVTLQRRIDFADPETSENSGDSLHSVLFDQQVDVESQTRDLAGKLIAIDRLRSRNLKYELIADRVTADGPGWASSARYGSSGLDPGPDPSAPPRGLGTSTPATSPEALTYTQVDFQHQLIADTYRREVHFTGGVEAVHGPIRNWQSRLSPRASGGLGEDEVLLKCDTLTAVEMGPPDGGRRNLELRALGNTYAQGREFHATADRITFSNLKDLIVLEGNGREDARLTQQRFIGGQENRFAASKILYWKSLRRVEVNDARLLDLNDLNSLRGAAKSPGPAAR